MEEDTNQPDGSSVVLQQCGSNYDESPHQRLRCLELAVAVAGNTADEERIVGVADAFYDFMTNGA